MRGRPKGTVKYPKQYRIRLTQFDYDILSNMAKEHKCTVAEQIRRIINIEVTNWRKYSQ